jgi:hypothetical protein
LIPSSFFSNSDSSFVTEVDFFFARLTATTMQKD